MAENHFGFEASASDISLSTWNFNVDDILVNGALAPSVDNSKLRFLVFLVDFVFNSSNIELINKLRQKLIHA
jgi:hypothetical protein